MGKVQLVDEDLMEGERVVEAVSPTGRLLAAMWLYHSDAGTYYLVLALSEVSPLAAYSKVQGVLAQLRPPSSIALEDIRIVKADGCS
jgi:hypothetical protein